MHTITQTHLINYLTPQCHPEYTIHTFNSSHATGLGALCIITLNILHP